MKINRVYDGDGILFLKKIFDFISELIKIKDRLRDFGIENLGFS